MVAMRRCSECHVMFDASRKGTMREITGWEETRHQGGANRIARRMQTGRYAHRACIQLLAGQDESLF